MLATRAIDLLLATHLQIFWRPSNGKVIDNRIDQPGRQRPDHADLGSPTQIVPDRAARRLECAPDLLGADVVAGKPQHLSDCPMVSSPLADISHSSLVTRRLMPEELT